MKKLLLTMGVAATIISSCSTKPASDELTLSGLDAEKFKTEVNGEQVSLYTLKNTNGVEVCLTNYGGRIVSVMVPDKNGQMKDVVLGFDNVDDYINVDNNFGATIGRYGNRINQGKIVIDDVEYQLPQNNFGHSLHGGPQGWDTKVFKTNVLNDKSVEMSIVSPDGDANYPGTIHAKVTFTLTDDNAIDLKYEATTDKKTIINLTNHSYFNLSGNPNNPITNDLLYINADNFTPVDNTFMTTGEILPVADTPMDFTTAKPIGKEINNYDYDQLKNGDGYDHNWVLNTDGNINVLAAKVTSPESGISLEVYTNEPGVQVYTGNFLDGKVTGKNGIAYAKRTAICLETQHYPDSPNKPDWPSVILEPGETYNSRCIYKFTVE